MRATRVFVVALIAAIAFALPLLPRPVAAQATGATFKAGDIVIETPWMRATPHGAGVAAGYMKITNNGKDADRLVSATIAGAPRVEIHEMRMSGNVMEMRPLPQGIELKPGVTVEFKPSGYHVMAMNFPGGYKAGDTVKGTLTFEKAGKVDIAYRVEPVGAAAPGHSPGRTQH